MATATRIGVDGCKGGWIATYRSAGALRYRIFCTARDLAFSSADADRVFVDIPIGLPWSGQPMRACDQQARRVLGRRKSSVFPVPCRQATAAPDPAESRAANITELGRSLSAQTLAIRHKIAEVDALLRDNADLRGRWREVHPEVCFWGLNNGVALSFSKRHPRGVEERLGLLAELDPTVPAFLAEVLRRERRTAVGCDDVLDALVALLTAEARLGELFTLPARPDPDPTGLQMEMVYRRLGAATSVE